MEPQRQLKVSEMSGYSTYGLLQALLGRESFGRIAHRAKDRRYIFGISAHWLNENESTLLEFLGEKLGLLTMPTVPQSWRPERIFGTRLADSHDCAFSVVRTRSNARILLCLDPTWVPDYIYTEGATQICLTPYPALESLLIRL